MENKLDRRSFLKATALTGAALFVGDIFLSKGYAQSTVAIPESEKMIITVITDNLADATRPHYKIARRHLGTGSFLERALHGEHGLSYHIETTVNGQPHQFLFDFATDFQGVKKNIELLNIDFKKIEAFGIES